MLDKDMKEGKLRQYLNGTYLASETDEVYQCLLEECERQDAIEAVASEIWEEAKVCGEDHAKETAEYYQEAKSLIQHLTPKKKVRKPTRWIYASVSIAASILLIVGITYLRHNFNSTNPTLTEAVTSVGEKKQILLPDGSKVMMNACSKLIYPNQFDCDTRTVKLIGQAFFEVAHDDTKPFLVEANDINVKVLGTVFDIKTYPSDEMASVSVQSGKVEVQWDEATLRLKQDDQVLLNRYTGELKTKKGNKHVASWRKEYFVFYCTPIRDVIRELQRTYHCTIRFEDGHDFNNLISGEHDNQSLESILESLHYISGINYREENGIITLYK